MSDRERVLMNIAVDTAGTVHDKMRRLNGGWQLRFLFDRPAAQFIPEELAEKIGMPMKPGDIVRCVTNPDHRWGISEFVERRPDYGHFLLREIGGGRLCEMNNERLDVLRFMAPSRLYTGAKYRIYQWATGKAFRKPYNPDGDCCKRCGGVEFDGNTLVIWCRPHIWALEKQGDNGTKLYAQPKKFRMQWSNKTRLKDIVAVMREQGFADDFDWSPTWPTEGQAGYATFRRADIERVLRQAALA